MQIDDIISVVNWAIEQPSIDAQRIGLWGTSFGGCHVFGAAVTAVRGGITGNQISQFSYYNVRAHNLSYVK